MACQGGHLTLGGEVPNPHRAIVRAGIKRLAIAGEDEIRDVLLMAEQGGDSRSGVRIPESDFRLGSAGNEITLRREGERLDRDRPGRYRVPPSHAAPTR